MDGIDSGGRRPDGVGEMRRVRDDELFDIDDVGDEQDVDKEKGENGDISRSFGEWDDVFVHVRNSSIASDDFSACCHACTGGTSSSSDFVGTSMKTGSLLSPSLNSAYNPETSTIGYYWGY